MVLCVRKQTFWSTVMVRISSIKNARRRQSGESGAQSLEWIGLGSFVMTAMLAATAYAKDHLGDQVGDALIHHLKTFVQ